ncbi:4-methylaminobutanoate oxidase (formaldehyde-forming) [bacterium HR26]|nr:4-methylaminobutanoate oxidase (formaldehyde-forming) [bacterium HR26]
MPDTADVVVIGAGVNGASTAFHLARAGVRRVVVVERSHIAAGATGKSGALVRMHYTNPFESKLAFESLKIFQAWSDLVGGDSPFVRTGFIQVVGPEYEEHLRRNVADQQALGIDARVISAQELKAMEPWCDVEGLTWVAYEPDSGYADPYATTCGFLRRAQELGVEVRTHTEAVRVLTHGDRVTGVETSGGTIEAPVVVLAPGAWANRLLKPLGLDYGLYPRRAQVMIYRWPCGFNHRHMTYIDAVLNTWFRREGENCTLVGVEVGVLGADPDDYDETGDQEFVAPTRSTLALRFPVMAEAPLRGSWAGMIMMSPDDRPIIDQVPQYQGLFVMLGDSGTSFKTAPAIGKCLAEWITEGRPQTADLRPFRSTRFAEGQPWEDATNYGRARRTISR